MKIQYTKKQTTEQKQKTTTKQETEQQQQNTHRHYTKFCTHVNLWWFCHPDETKTSSVF